MELKKVRSHLKNTLYFLKIQIPIILKYFRFESGIDSEESIE
ncbi:hypothetical protein LEP1GSC071_0283 [Leptospira santarosai str. JET]|nr:hypothetical protein LEP1GSC071_0283 [Leptospira santarosai str. JET]